MKPTLNEIIGKDKPFVEIKYTGAYPALCMASWVIYVNGKSMTKLSGSMNTYGEYEQWSFDDNWSEVFESYDDGLEYEEWKEDMSGKLVIKALKGIGLIVTDGLLKNVYKQINAQDFRSGSCGGCI